MVKVDNPLIKFAEAYPLVCFALFGLLLWILISGGLASVKASNSPEGLPWVGIEEGQMFALTRAGFASVRQGRDWLTNAYQKVRRMWKEGNTWFNSDTLEQYSQQGQAYMFPDISGRHEIIIPNKQTRWLTDKPDHVASVGKAHYDMLQGDYAFTDPYLLGELYHEHVVHKNLARKLDALIPDLWDEVKACFDESWGVDTNNFKDIKVWDNDMWIISRLSNRMFVGKPLCRNKDFLKNNAAFAMDVIFVITLMPFFPRFLFPILGRLLTIPNRYHAWRITNIVMPHVKQRLADIAEKDTNPSSKIDIPEDYITWHIRTARAEGKHKELEPQMIAKFLLPIEFAAIHTTAMTVTMTLFDLFSSDPSKHFVEGLREEAVRLYVECGGTWNKQTLSKMVRADSAIRESMRLSTFMTRGVQRKILVEGGLKNDQEGWTAPQGSYVSVDLYSRQHDPDIYPNPDQYDAFRFSRPREEHEASKTSATDTDEYLKMRNLSMISTGEDFLVFGHGRHACPGRFFVQHEIKMMLAYIVMNYEVPLLPARPSNQWLGTSIIPPTSSVLKVKRRA